MNELRSGVSLGSESDCWFTSSRPQDVALQTPTRDRLNVAAIRGFRKRHDESKKNLLGDGCSP